MAVPDKIRRLESFLTANPALADVPALMVAGRPTTLREALDHLRAGRYTSEIIAGLAVLGVDLPWQLCVPPSTNVYSNPEPTPIVSISVGDRVLGAGEQQKVLRVFERHYRGELVEIKPKYFEAVLFTPEHPLLIAERWKTQRSIGKIRRVVWKRVEEVRKTDCVVVPKHMLPEDEQIIDFGRYSRGSLRKLPERMMLTPELAELCGWYVAEGYTCKKSGEAKDNMATRFCLGPHEAENVERILSLLRSLNLRGNARRAATAIVVIANSPVLARFLKDSFGTGAHNKRIAPFIMNSKKEVAEAFLRGCWAGDGCSAVNGKGKVYWKYATCSKTLAKQIQLLLLLKLGISSTFYEAHTQGDGVIGGRHIRGGTHYQVIYCHHEKRKELLEDEDDYYIPIRRIRRQYYEGNVYNLETEENVYLVPFVAHNCQEFYRRLVAARPEAKLYALGFIPPVSPGEALRHVEAKDETGRQLVQAYASLLSFVRARVNV